MPEIPQAVSKEQAERKERNPLSGAEIISRKEKIQPHDPGKKEEKKGLSKSTSVDLSLTFQINGFFKFQSFFEVMFLVILIQKRMDHIKVGEGIMCCFTDLRGCLEAIFDKADRTPGNENTERDEEESPKKKDQG